MVPYPNKISTNHFRVSTSIYAREETERLATRFWWIPSIPIFILVCSGIIIDWRWLIVAAAILFIALPTLMMFAWIHLLSKPGIVEAIFPTSIQYYPNLSMLYISYHPLQNNGNEEENDKKEDVSECVPASIKPSRIPKSFVCTTEDIIACDEWSNHIRLAFSHKIPISQLMIPISSFTTENDASIFFNSINEKIYASAFSSLR